MQSMKLICAAYHPITKMFSLPFDLDYKELTLQMQMKLIDLQCPEDFQSKFLTYHILDFYETIPKPYHPHPASS